jgi:hypothetical protein
VYPLSLSYGIIIASFGNYTSDNNAQKRVKIFVQYYSMDKAALFRLKRCEKVPPHLFQCGGSKIYLFIRFP